MLDDSAHCDLAIFYVNKAAQCLQSAEKTIADDDFDTAANRSYYSVFNSMKAVLALDRFDSKNHGEIIGKFRKDYIKTGIFPARYSDIIRDAEVVRNDCDYQAFHVASKNGVSIQVENAREFLAVVKEYTMNRIQPQK